jgi:hypothetical protein
MRLNLVAAAGSAAVHSLAFAYAPLMLAFELVTVPVCVDCHGWPLVKEPVLMVQTRTNFEAQRQPIPAGGFEPANRCEVGQAVDRDPVPRFPIFGDPLVPGTYGPDIVLCARIGTSGRVERLFYLRGSGNAAIDDRLIRHIRKLSFDPGLRSGRPISSWHRIVVHRRDQMPSI